MGFVTQNEILYNLHEYIYVFHLSLSTPEQNLHMNRFEMLTAGGGEAYRSSVRQSFLS